jgi:hypothetical protein
MMQAAAQVAGAPGSIIYSGPLATGPAASTLRWI